jgi:hypothetical protein
MLIIMAHSFCPVVQYMITDKVRINIYYIGDNYHKYLQSQVRSGYE